MFAGERGKAGGAINLRQQGQGRHVVHTRRHADGFRQGRALGDVLASGGANGGGAWPDEGEPRLFQRAHQCLVLRHEAVAGEDGVVTAGLGDADDLGDAGFALGGIRAGVVRHAMHMGTVAHGAQLRRHGVGVNHAVLV